MILGTIISISYVGIMYIISSIYNSNFKLTAYSIMLMVVCILSGMIGGIIGVNLHKEKKLKY